MERTFGVGNDTVVRVVQRYYCISYFANLWSIPTHTTIYIYSTYTTYILTINCYIYCGDCTLFKLTSQFCVGFYLSVCSVLSTHICIIVGVNIFVQSEKKLTPSIFASCLYCIEDIVAVFTFSFQRQLHV